MEGTDGFLVFCVVRVKLFCTPDGRIEEDLVKA